MTDAEQFLADLEAKAKAATHQGEWVVDDVPFTHGCAIRDANDDIVIDDGSAGGEYAETTTFKNMEYIAAADPAAVHRLVGMVREYDNEILRLRAEMERLEKEANWLARAASNNRWIGARVSPEWMRDAARKAVEEA